MLKQYKSSVAKKADASKYLKTKRAELDKLSSNDRKYHLLKLSNDIFGPFLNRHSYIRCTHQILSREFRYNSPLRSHYQVDEIINIYKAELKTLKKLLKRTIPGHIKKLLGKEFLANLNGAWSESSIPSLPPLTITDQLLKEEIETQVQVILEEIRPNKLKLNQKQKPLSMPTLLEIFSTPFYDDSLKHLILMSYANDIDDKALRELLIQIEQPSKLMTAPYFFQKKLRLSSICESYLLLSKYFNLPEIMKDFNPPKIKLPYYNSGIIKTILECSHPQDGESKESIRDALTEIFDYPVKHSDIKRINEAFQRVNSKQNK